MAKVLEQVIIIKLSKMVKDSNKDTSVITTDQTKLIEETIPALVEEVINDPSIVVEVAELD
jgi:hypothetical protein